MINYREIAFNTRASQDKFELWQLFELVSQIKPDVIVEIGIDKGHMMASLKKAFNPRVLLGINENMDAFDKFVNNKLRGLVVIGDSHDVATKANLEVRLGNDLIDFLFIDGDHTLAGVTADFEMYGSLVRPGGIIAFHDIMRDPARVPHHAGVECRAFFDSIKHRFANIEIWNGTAGDAGPGIGVIFV